MSLCHPFSLSKKIKKTYVYVKKTFLEVPKKSFSEHSPAT